MDKPKKDPNCIGHIVRILSNKTVIVSATSKDVKKGDVLAVYQISDELKDLDGKSLGTLIFDKDILVVKQTTSSYSLCEKKDYLIRKNKTVYGISKAIATLATSPLLEGYEEEENPLNVTEQAIQPLEIDMDPVIHLGDPVRRFTD